MHLRDRGCVRTLRPLFVYATAISFQTGHYWRRTEVEIFQDAATKNLQRATENLILLPTEGIEFHADC